MRFLESSPAPVRRLVPFTAVLLLAGCSGSDRTSETASGTAASPADGSTSARSTLTIGPTRELWGTCDASAVVALDSSTIVVANDEDNVLRLYDLGRASTDTVFATDSITVDSLLARFAEKGEGDLEGAARVDDTIWWIGSLGNHSSKAERPRRRALFTTTVQREGDRFRLVPSARAYGGLREALTADDSAHGKRFGLATSATLAPESGGINVEGLEAGANGELLVGFRSPVVGGRALVARVSPGNVLTDTTANPTVNGVTTLDLGGNGVRSIERIADGRYLIASGPVADSGSFRFYEWTPGGSGADSLRLLTATGLDTTTTMKVEALTAIPDAPGQFLVIADDGWRPVAGAEECKDLKKKAPKQMRFRVARATLTSGV